MTLSLDGSLCFSLLLSLVLSPLLPSRSSSPCNSLCGQQSEAAVTSVLSTEFFAQVTVPAYSWLLSLVAAFLQHDSHFALAPSSSLLKQAGDSPIWGFSYLLMMGQSTQGKMCSCTSMTTYIFFIIFWNASRSECTFFGESL